MAHLNQRPFSAVLIPWVIALVTLIGINAFIPDQARARKFDSSGESELSQLADDAKPLGRISSAQVFLAPHPESVTGLLDSSSRLVLIEKRRGQPVLRSTHGAVQGRAPPAGRLA